MKKQMELSDEQYIDKIVKLVYLADINFLVCEKIYSKLPENELLGYDFSILSANNSFYASIEILHTLICSKKQEELTIKPILEKIIEKEKASIPEIKEDLVQAFMDFLEKNYPTPDYYKFDFGTEEDNSYIGDKMADIRKKKRSLSGLTDLKELKKHFEGQNFHKIRHQSVAHKNKLLKEPGGVANLKLERDWIAKLGQIIKILRIDCYIWFDYELSNPCVSALESLDKLFIAEKN
ncbi:MAG: hypothetical protein PHX30_03855 [Candidatus Pacebacteria bacterium]|nr:hypothetical protein [Candidatus Paceibacterota bacterium]